MSPLKTSTPRDLDATKSNPFRAGSLGANIRRCYQSLKHFLTTTLRGLDTHLLRKLADQPRSGFQLLDVSKVFDDLIGAVFPVLDPGARDVLVVALVVNESVEAHALEAFDVVGGVVDVAVGADGVFESGEAEGHIWNAGVVKPGCGVRDDLAVTGSEDEPVGDYPNVCSGVGDLPHGF